MLALDFRLEFRGSIGIMACNLGYPPVSSKVSALHVISYTHMGFILHMLTSLPYTFASLILLAAIINSIE